MNHDELTPAEHADVRARLISGAARIRPVGRHRNAWIAGSVAVALVAVIAGGVGVGATLSAPPVASTPSPTSTISVPSPTPSSSSPTPQATTSATTRSEPSSASLPFGGDCAQLVGSDPVETDTPGIPDGAPDISETSWALTDSVASFRLIGGLRCSWPVSGRPAAEVTLLPASEVSLDLRERWSTWTCAGLSSYCGMGRVEGRLWIGVSGDLTDGSMYEDDRPEAATLEAESIISEVARRAAAEDATPAARAASWWSLPLCAELTEPVRTQVATDLVQGFPGDFVPSGMEWEIAVAAGIIDWCAWYSSSDYGNTLVELYMQPGVGAPSPDDIDASQFTPTSVAGADESWLFQDPGSADSFTIVAMDGPNRLTVLISGAPNRDSVRSLAADLVARLG